MKDQVNLRSYLEEKNISITEFSAMTGVSVPTIYRIIKDANRSISVDNVRSIYNGTEAKYGTGLGVFEYLNK